MKLLHTSSRSCLVNGRRTKLTGSIFPGGLPMPRKICKFIKGIKYSKDHNGNNYCTIRNIPILNRGKSRLPLKWSMILLILQTKANFTNYLMDSSLFFHLLFGENHCDKLTLVRSINFKRTMPNSNCALPQLVNNLNTSKTNLSL